MLKKYIRSTIIVMIQIFMPAMLFLLLAPQLLEKPNSFMKREQLLDLNMQGIFKGIKINEPSYFPHACHFSALF